MEQNASFQIYGITKMFANIVILSFIHSCNEMPWLVFSHCYLCIRLFFFFQKTANQTHSVLTEMLTN